MTTGRDRIRKVARGLVIVGLGLGLAGCATTALERRCADAAWSDAPMLLYAPGAGAAYIPGGAAAWDRAAYDACVERGGEDQ